MKTVTINKTKYTLKYTLRILFIFENLTGYPFVFGKTIDEYLLFYSTLLANNESFTTPFDEFIKVCENDPRLFMTFKEFIINELELQKQMYNTDKNDVKKKTRKKKQ